MEPNTKCHLYGILNLLSQRRQISFASRVTHQCQCVTLRYPCALLRRATHESRALDKPRRWDFVPPAGLRIGIGWDRRDCLACESPPASTGLFVFVLRENRIEEEGTCRTRIGVVRVNDHRLAATQIEDDITHGLCRSSTSQTIKIDVSLHDLSLKLWIANLWPCRGFKSVRRSRHDVAISIATLETTIPVGELTGLGVEGCLPQRHPVEHIHLCQDIADLLTIGANVLDGCGADETRDTGKTLQTDQIRIDGGLHESVPILPCGGVNDGFGATHVELNTSQFDTYDETIQALVVEERVATPAQHLHRNRPRRRPLKGLTDFFHRRTVRQITCRPPNAKGGEGRQGYVFVNIHRSSMSHSCRVAAAPGIFVTFVSLQPKVTGRDQLCI